VQKGEKQLLAHLSTLSTSGQKQAKTRL